MGIWFIGAYRTRNDEAQAGGGCGHGEGLIRAEVREEENGNLKDSI